MPDPVQNQPAHSTSQTDAVSTKSTVPVNTTTPVDISSPPAPVNGTTPGTNSLVSPSSLLDVLLSEGHLEKEVVNQLKSESLTTGQPAETIIKEKQLVSEEVLTKAKAKFNNIPFVKISETGVSPEAISLIDESVARRYKLLPFALNKEEQKLMVVMDDPLDLQAVDFASQKTGLNIVVHYAMPSELERMIAQRYAQNLSSEVTEALEDTSQVAEQQAKQQDLTQLSHSIVRDAPINRIVETILDFAIKARASDVHIEPQPGRTRVRYRIDGILVEKLILPKSVHEAVISRIKILTDLKIDERRIPQDGRFNYATSDQEVDLRVSTLPTIHGEKVVMRILKKDTTVPTLEELGLSGLALKNVNEAIRVPHGIVLVTGPTGSGKTTTLYSALHLINTPKVNIMTLEDPVEYQMAGINQVQTNDQAGLTFSSGLRSFLRQDPDIIMVGEIRDAETAELAIQASLTGHLVFSTLHTSSAAGALPRLLDMGAESFLLASSMTLAMAQRVVRRINKRYKEEYKPEQAVIEDIKRVLGDKFDAWCSKNKKTADSVTLFRPKAERPHNETEYEGRIAIYEVMPISEEIGKLIMERRPAVELEKVALKNGMMLMKQDGYFKTLDGITTIEEVLRVAEV